MRSKKPPPGGRGLPQSIRAATVIGLGGIGRCVAMQLAALRVPRLQLVDARLVTRRAQRRQGYAYEDIGRPMVHATAHACHQISPTSEIETVQRRSLRGLHFGGLVFLCSGSAAALRALRHRASDMTMVVACCTVGDTAIHLAYTRVPGSLAVWPDEGARSRRHRPVPIHVATLAAGLLVAEFTRFAATSQATRSIRLDLQNLDILVEESA